MRRNVSTSLVWLLIALPLAALAADPSPRAATEGGSWPQYRGPSRDGVSTETGLLRSWPAAGPKVLWRTPLGDGYSAISVAGGRAFTMFSREGGEFVACFKADDGKEVWRLRIDDVRADDQGDGPRSTPTIDGDLVYALGARGVLAAVRTASGEKAWQKDLKEVFGARVPQWGVSTSPLVEGDLLVLDAGGGPGNSLVALDKKTGATRWTAHTDRPGYSSPIAREILGVRQILSFAGTSLVSVAAADGKVLWSVPWKTSYDVNAATPVFIPPDKVFISSSYDTGGAVYQIRRNGGSFEASQVWKSRIMKNHFNSSVYHDGHLYGFDDATLRCIDAATGQEKWSQRGFAKGSLLLADGHLIVFGESGLLALVEATPEAYREKARFQVFDGRTWTMPTLAGKKLFLRDRKEMVALDLAG